MPPQVITYAYIRGRWYAFPDTNSAREGVLKYNGNYQSIRLSRPVGAVIDEETLVNKNFWPPSLANAPGVTGSALINPPYNPIQGPTPVTPVVETPVTTTTPASTSSAPQSTGGGGGGGSQGTDYYGGPKRTTGKYIAGTKILQSEVNANLRANSGDAKYWEERLANTDDPNDVLFEMAFHMGDRSKMDDSGQGNPFVGKLQAGQYKMLEGPTWAQEATAGASGTTDVYQIRDKTGKVTGVQEGPEWSQQFKEGEWEPGDFGTSAKKKADANIWKRKHLLAAGDDEAQQNKVKKRWRRMVEGQ
jgi:hypothetical protein